MVEESGFQLHGSGAEIYEKFWVAAQMGQCAEELVTSAGVGSGDHVLDVACGTGVVARTAAARCRRRCNRHGGRRQRPHADRGTPSWQLRPGIPAFAGSSAVRRTCRSMTTHSTSRSASRACSSCQTSRPHWRRWPGRSGPGGRLALSVWKCASPLGNAFATVLDGHFGAGTTAPLAANVLAGRSRGTQGPRRGSGGSPAST